ncbi:hypothetical protein AB0L57_03755 [Nocardia sp. NPDC052254]|uniref:hypothetical protein n=1 Tax=Nocardia sp. NPDC052254 TaxID=3155681 RepID=UPI00341DA792
MQPLQCAECRAEVLVRKNSWEHTSVQWNAEARAACRELSNARSGNPDRPGLPLPRCGKLTETIETAARDGRLEIADPAPVRPLAESH